MTHAITLHLIHHDDPRHTVSLPFDAGRYADSISLSEAGYVARLYAKQFAGENFDAWIEHAVNGRARNSVLFAHGQEIGGHQDDAFMWLADDQDA